VSILNAKNVTQGQAMLTLDEIREQLADRNIKAVAQKAGIHPNAVYRFMKGQSNPSYETVRRLCDYLEGKQ